MRNSVISGDPRCAPSRTRAYCVRALKIRVLERHSRARNANICAYYKAVDAAYARIFAPPRGACVRLRTCVVSAADWHVHTGAYSSARPRTYKCVFERQEVSVTPPIHCLLMCALKIRVLEWQSRPRNANICAYYKAVDAAYARTFAPPRGACTRLRTCVVSAADWHVHTGAYSSARPRTYKCVFERQELSVTPPINCLLICALKYVRVSDSKHKHMGAL